MKDYSKLKKIIIIVIFLIGIISIYYFVNTNNKKEIREYKEVNKVDSKRFKIYLEQPDGKYVESKNGWPKEGYIFNESKTTCVDYEGNSISNILEYKNNTLYLKTNKSVFCNVYFASVSIVRIEAEVKDEYKKVTMETKLNTKMFNVTAFYSDGSSALLNNDDFIINNNIAPSVEGKFEVTINLNPNKFKEQVDEVNVFMEVIKIIRLEATVKTSYKTVKPATELNTEMFEVVAIFNDNSTITLNPNDFIIDKNVAPKEEGSFSIKISLNNIKFVENLSANVSMTVVYPTLITGKKFKEKIPSDITRVIFTDVTAPSNASLIDVSENQDKSIVAWIEGTTFKVSPQITGIKVLANPDSSNMFSDRTKLEYIDVTNLDTKNVTSMYWMFTSTGEDVSRFEIIGLDNWDTSKVTDMSWMFWCAGEVATSWSIGNLSRWNTGKVTDMSKMFSHAGNKASIFNIGDISNWNTANVTTMEDMFWCAGEYSKSFYIGTLSNWNTGKVTDMSQMFSYMGNSASSVVLDLSNWNVSNTVRMQFMFVRTGYSASTFSLGDLSKWNTASVIYIYNMFVYTGYNANWYIDCSGWNVSKTSGWSWDFNTGSESKVKAPPGLDP